MKKFMFLLFGAIGFLLLNLYSGFIPHIIHNYPNTSISQIFTENPEVWFLFWILFFPLAYFVARFLLKLKGLTSFGLNFKLQWKKQLMMGLMIGLSLKIILYSIYYNLGKFEIAGVTDFSSLFTIFLFGTLIAIFPSIINDLTIRGFFLGYFRRLHLMKWFVVITALVYAFDDIWNEGLSFTNTLFSFIYGISLGYTVLKTGAIWMSFGLHIGGNFIYQMLNGPNGQGLLIQENVSSGRIFEYINILLGVMLFLFLYLYFNYSNKPSPSPPAALPG